MAVQFRVEYNDFTVDDIPIYRPGQQVRGRVVLRVLGSMTARDIKLHISGKAKVHWTETRQDSSLNTGRSDTQTIDFRSEVTYLDEWILLWTSPDQILPVGDHVFPFTFAIPAHCPPTFTGSYGNIVYECTVEIDRPSKVRKFCFLSCNASVDNESFTSFFLVSPVYDLNAIEWVRYPQQHQISKSIGSGCCKRGILLAEVCLPKSGFVHGERIPITINIRNNTSREVTKVRAMLVQQECYTGSEYRSQWREFDANDRYYKHREARNELVKLKEYVKIAPGGDDIFEGELLVPPCAPSFDNCPIIRVEHWLEVKINVHGCCCDRVAYSSLQVMIGTIGVNY